MSKLAHAYIDESGRSGPLDGLVEKDDHLIAVIASLVVPADETVFREVFDGPFDAFCKARPHEQSRLHITDAFERDKDKSFKSQVWATAATAARTDIYAALLRLGIPIVYEARRMRVARSTRDFTQASLPAAAGADEEQIVETLMTGVALKLDAFASDFGIDTIDLFTDHLEPKPAKLFEKSIDSTRTITSEKVVLGPRADNGGSGVISTVSFAITDANGEKPWGIDSQHLRNLKVVGKNDSLVFAADVVANSLHYHLRGLAHDQPLNHPSSIQDWQLAPLVFGCREDAWEDRF